jgi:hypothetical protein
VSTAKPELLPELTTSTPAVLFKLTAWTVDADRELPRQGYGYRPDMTAAEFYDSVRTWWVLNPQLGSSVAHTVSASPR